MNAPPSGQSCYNCRYSIGDECHFYPPQILPPGQGFDSTTGKWSGNVAYPNISTMSVPWCGQWLTAPPGP